MCFYSTSERSRERMVIKSMVQYSRSIQDASHITTNYDYAVAPCLLYQCLQMVTLSLLLNCFFFAYFIT